MGRTALYRDPAPFRPARAEPQLDALALALAMPDGKLRRHALDGCAVATADGVALVRGAHALVRHDPRTGALLEVRPERRFVRVLVLERRGEHHTIITPPDRGALAPAVVRLPEVPTDAAILEEPAWEALADWLVGGGRLAGCTIAELARLAAIATPQFAAVIGEVAAARALEAAALGGAPLRRAGDVDGGLQPLVAAARVSPRAAEALVAAHAYLAGARGRAQ